jgi:hypothetical protein
VSCDNFGSGSFEIKYCAGKQFFFCVICITKCHHSVSTGIILVTHRNFTSLKSMANKRDKLNLMGEIGCGKPGFSPRAFPRQASHARTPRHCTTRVRPPNHHFHLSFYFSKKKSTTKRRAQRRVPAAAMAAHLLLLLLGKSKTRCGSGDGGGASTRRSARA